MTAATDNIFDAIREDDRRLVAEILRDEPAAAAARDKTGLSAVLLARYYGRTDILETLLDAAPDLDVFEAAAVGRTERVEELVEQQPGLVASWSSDGFTPLHLAAFFGHPEIARFLLEAGSDVDMPSRNPMRVTPLHSACAAGQREIVRELVSRGADANARQEGGFVPLHSAAQNGDEPLARILLEYGADRAATNDEGKTAADFARDGGHAHLAALLEAR